MFHAAARSATRDLALTRRELKTVRRIVRCQRSARSRRIVRFHWRRYKRGHLRRVVAAMPPRRYARYLLRRRPGQYGCLNVLIGRESGWRVDATNPTSGAYGIPQALPGSKMASHGADWRWNPRTQLRWMVDYCDGRYGSPCRALAHSLSTGWY